MIFFTKKNLVLHPFFNQIRHTTVTNSFTCWGVKDGQLVTRLVYSNRSRGLVIYGTRYLTLPSRKNLADRPEENRTVTLSAVEIPLK